jgi:hypothetical protein
MTKALGKVGIGGHLLFVQNYPGFRVCFEPTVQKDNNNRRYQYIPLVSEGWAELITLLPPEVSKYFTGC